MPIKTKRSIVRSLEVMMPGLCSDPSFVSSVMKYEYKSLIKNGLRQTMFSARYGYLLDEYVYGQDADEVDLVKIRKEREVHGETLIEYAIELKDHNCPKALMNLPAELSAEREKMLLRYKGRGARLFQINLLATIKEPAHNGLKIVGTKTTYERLGCEQHVDADATFGFIKDLDKDAEYRHFESMEWNGYKATVHAYVCLIK